VAPGAASGGPGGVPLIAVTAQWLFWIAVGLLIYAYGLYPIMVIAVARVLGRPSEPRVSPANSTEPTVAVVVAAYNEDASIAARIERERGSWRRTARE